MRYIVVILFVLSGIQAPAQEFVFRAKVANPYQGKIYLFYQNTIDSTEVNNQEFVFQGKLDYAVKANVSPSKNNASTGFFILDNASVEAEIVVENRKNVYFKTIKGSPSVEALTDYIRLKNKHANEPNFNQLLFSKLKELILQSPQSQVCGMLLAEVLSDKTLTLSQAQTLLAILDTGTQSPHDMERILASVDALEKTQIGSVFPNIAFLDELGKSLSLQSQLGSYTLLSFSSSECILCIELDRKLKSVFSKFRKKGFVIYEVFLEQNRAIWLSLLHQEKIEWKSVLALQKYNNPVLKSLGITTIPTNFLLDNKGRIVQINVGPAKLNALLEAYYKTSF